MVFVDVEVAVRLHRQRDPAVVGDLREHVVQEAQARRDAVVEVAPAVEVQLYADLRLARVALHLHAPLPAADELRNLRPRVGRQHAGLCNPRLLRHPPALLRRAEQDAPRPEVAGQLEVRHAVADDVASGEVVCPVQVAGKHPRAGFARRGVVALEGAVDECVVEADAFAAERRKHLFVRRPEGRLREGAGPQAVLVRSQHQLEIQSREGLESRDGARNERQLVEAVDLFVGRFRDDRAVAVDEEGFFQRVHGRKFWTVCNRRSFSSGRPIVMRRHPAQPGIRERLRTITPAAISVS